MLPLLAWVGVWKCDLWGTPWCVGVGGISPKVPLSLLSTPMEVRLGPGQVASPPPEAIIPPWLSGGLWLGVGWQQ